MGLDKFQVLECCECSAYAAAAMAANQKEWERKKKRERTPRVLCSWCARRGTMPINAIPADYVLLYNACEAAPSDAALPCAPAAATITRSANRGR